MLALISGHEANACFKHILANAFPVCLEFLEIA